LPNVVVSGNTALFFEEAKVSLLETVIGATVSVNWATENLIAYFSEAILI